MNYNHHVSAIFQVKDSNDPLATELFHGFQVSLMQ